MQRCLKPGDKAPPPKPPAPTPPAATQPSLAQPPTIGSTPASGGVTNPAVPPINPLQGLPPDVLNKLEEMKKSEPSNTEDDGAEAFYDF